MAALACRDYYVHTQDVVRARRVSGEDRFAARRCRRCLSHRPKDATSTRRHVLVELASPAATGEPPFAVRAAPSTRATRSTPDRSRGRTTSARRWPSCRSRPSTSWNGGAPAPSRLVDCISVLSVRHPPQASLAALAGRLARDARLYLAPEDGRALAARARLLRPLDARNSRFQSAFRALRGSSGRSAINSKMICWPVLMFAMRFERFFRFCPGSTWSSIARG